MARNLIISTIIPVERKPSKPNLLNSTILLLRFAPNVKTMSVRFYDTNYYFFRIIVVS